MNPRHTINRLLFPFSHIVDEHNNSLGFVAVRGPFRHEDDESFYYKLKENGFRFIGISSFLSFPEIEIEPGDLRDYVHLCEGWCHCFRYPERYFPTYIPHILLSESDMKNPRLFFPSFNKEYDFAYVCNNNTWSEINKNWNLMQKCIPILCDILDLRGVIFGKKDADNEPKHRNIENYQTLKQDDFLRKLARSRMLIVPSIRDASPRVITEALCSNVPIVVNENILGGWKYVNDKTGAFFNNEYDIETAVRSVLSSKILEPRSWFIAHSGNIRSGIALLNFLKSLGGPVTNTIEASRMLNAKIARISQQIVFNAT